MRHHVPAFSYSWAVFWLQASLFILTQIFYGLAYWHVFRTDVIIWSYLCVVVLFLHLMSTHRVSVLLNGMSASHTSGEASADTQRVAFLILISTAAHFSFSLSNYQYLSISAWCILAYCIFSMPGPGFDSCYWGRKSDISNGCIKPSNEIYLTLHLCSLCNVNWQTMTTRVSS